jgi:hypothetical protein
VTLIVTIIRAIGLPACIVIGLLVFYEGVPGASRIAIPTTVPVVGGIGLVDVPVLGNLSTGRVNSYAAEQVRLATAELVSRSELTAAQAQLARERELRQAAQNAEVQARLRAHAAGLAASEARDRLEALIASDDGDDGATLTEEDIRWLAQ